MEDETVDGDAAENEAPILAQFPVGVVLRRTRGATRWAAWNWSVATLLPGAASPGAHWRVLSEDPDTGLMELHAATPTLELHRAEVEGYRVSLTMTPPSVFVVLRPCADPNTGEPPLVHLITASAYEAQDYGDGDEEIVEAAPAPELLREWIDGFVDAHWRDQEFKKRKRDRYEQAKQDGKGDPRVRQTADVYRAPAALKPKNDKGSRGGGTGSGSEETS